MNEFLRVNLRDRKKHTGVYVGMKSHFAQKFKPEPWRFPPLHYIMLLHNHCLIFYATAATILDGTLLVIAAQLGLVKFGA